MRLHQFNIRYDAEEDRMILRFNTSEREELRFFFTRRFVQLLWPVLRKLLRREQAMRNPSPGPAVDALVDFERERFMAAGNFQTPFQEEAAAYPLGERPVLLARIQVKRTPEGERLCLHPSEGPGVELPARPKLIHTLCRLIREASVRADWKLDLPEAAVAGMESAPEKSRLH
jgi:hypothetical protein